MAKILLVDDVPAFVETEKALLEECGLDYHVRIASTYEVAIQALQSERFDLVILDLMMPKKNGLEMLHEIKRRWKLPVIIYSAYLENVPPHLILKEGADQVLSKPAPLDLFLNCIRNVLDPSNDTTIIIVHGFRIREIKNQVLAVIIQKVLRKTESKITAAADVLGISRECLSAMMAKLGISR